jgi:hypothetical protein
MVFWVLGMVFGPIVVAGLISWWWSPMVGFWLLLACWLLLALSAGIAGEGRRERRRGRYW